MAKLGTLTAIFTKYPGRSLVGAAGLIGIAALVADYNTSASEGVENLRSANLAHKEKLPGLHKKAHATALELLAHGADPKLCDTLRMAAVSLQTTLSLMETNASLLDLKNALPPEEKRTFGLYIEAFRRPDPDVGRALDMCK